MKVKGYWWLPSNSDDRIAGELTFENNDHTILELFGCFKRFDNNHRGLFYKNACEIIFGIDIEGEKYTLMNSRCIKCTGSDYVSCSFIAEFILKGVNLYSIDDKCFKVAELTFKNLIKWYDNNLIEMDFENSYEIFKCDLSENSRRQEILLSDGASFVIKPICRSNVIGKLEEIHLSQTTQVVLNDKTEYSVLGYLQRAQIVEQFVSLLFLSPQFFDELFLSDGSEDGMHCQVFVQNETSKNPILGPFLRYEMIKDKLGTIIEKWINNSQDLFQIQAHLFRTLDSSKSLGDEDFLIIAQAIDGFSKLKLSMNCGLKDNIDKLYDILNGITRLQKNKIDSEIFNATRNYYAHMAKGKDYNKVAKGKDLRMLLHKAKLLLTCALLHFYGLEDEEIDESLKHSVFAANIYLDM